MLNKSMKPMVMGVGLFLVLMQPLMAFPKIVADVEQSIDLQQAAQAKLINQGVRRGALTFSEAESLRKEQWSIHQLEASMKSDEELSEQEAYRLLRLLGRAERRIVMEMTDDERRWKRDE